MRDNAGIVTDEPSILSTALQSRIVGEIAAAGGWLSFERFMELALYAPGLGYYANDSAKFGLLPESGSDFVTAPEMSPVFGQLLAQQVDEALQQTQTREIWEFGAGTGALALQILEELERLGRLPERYTIVDLSGSLRARQQLRLTRYEKLLHWVDRLPEQLQGVIIGNEVLDAMPVQLLQRRQGEWFERGVAVADAAGAADGADHPFRWEDRPSSQRPPIDIDGPHDYLTEIHRQGEAFIRTLGEKLVRGAVFLIDYGFGESEYYHVQRHMGTLVCHYQHLVDSDPLVLVGHKDITAHVNFTGSALAAEDAGFDILGYTTQAHFLINCGLAARLDTLDIAGRSMAAKLVMEHEMGELFKVLALSKGADAWTPLGFREGDRTHRL